MNKSAKLLVFLLFIIATIEFSHTDVDLNELSSQEFKDLIESELTENKRTSNSEKILSRRRRYLIFPQGSSLQLVYDQIIPIVDYTNLFILGITIAFAWELPSKPPSEQLDNIKQHLEDGTLGLRKDENVNDLKYVDELKKKPPLKYPSLESKYPAQTIQSLESLSNNKSVYFRPPVKYYNSPFFTKYMMPLSSSASKFYSDQNKYSSSNLYQSYFQPNSSWNFRRKGDYQWNHSSWNRDPSRLSNAPRNRTQTKPSKRYPSNTERSHRIYPVFGKRSINGNQKDGKNKLTNEEILDLKYHRSSRHDLYERIEKYLDSLGKNGQDCVLKALCETRSKQDETEPGTFIGEIMRTVFSIPEPCEVHRLTRRERIYDIAHGHIPSDDPDHARKNCSERYPGCPESLWTADFIF